MALKKGALEGEEELSMEPLCPETDVKWGRATDLMLCLWGSSDIRRGGPVFGCQRALRMFTLAVMFRNGASMY